MIRRVLVSAVLFLLLLSPRLASAQQASPVPSAPPQATPVTASAAALYCESVGGIVRERTPTYGTNDPSTQFALAWPQEFCEFTGGAGADPSDSWISVSLDTLYSTNPTLAALAYLTTPPVPQSSNGANPASLYCAKLGGTEIGSTTLSGGGWVTTDTTPINPLQACVFPDGSIIDSWGITYHANGTIRGADLTDKFRYQSANPPHVFPGQ